MFITLIPLLPLLLTLTSAIPQLLPPANSNACQTCKTIRSSCVQYCSIVAYNDCVVRGINSLPCVQCYGKLPSTTDLSSLLPTTKTLKREVEEGLERREGEEGLEKREVEGLERRITPECQTCQTGKMVCANFSDSAVGYVQCNADLAADQSCVICQETGCTLTG